EWMAELGQRATVKVATIGKIKTIAQMVALSCLLYSINPRYPLQPGTDIWMSVPAFHIGDWLLGGAALLTLWSGCAYQRAAGPALRAAEKSAVDTTRTAGKMRGSTGE